VFGDLFYKYRLFFRMKEEFGSSFELNGFLEYTKQECQPFIQSFVRTLSFKKFLESRGPIKSDFLKKYLFDKSVEKRIKKKRSELIELRRQTEQAHLIVARGSGRWHTRWVTVEYSMLNIFKSKKNTTPKHTKDLKAGSCRVVIPVIETNSGYFTFQICPLYDSKLPAGAKRPDVFHFRTENKTDRRKWVRILRARVMEEQLQNRYEKFS